MRGEKRILADLAKFHGTAIALKLKNPDVFDTRIKPLCSTFIFKKDKIITETVETIRNTIKSFPEYSHLAEKATSFPDRNTPLMSREPYATIIHFDLWVNNLLNKIDKEDILRNVFVDFQVYDFRSPAADVFFHLWTSVQKEVLELHLDDLILFYHENLLETLNSFKIDTSQFTIEKFYEEIRLEADFELGHALMFASFTKAPPKEMADVPANYKLEVGENLREYFHFMISECLKRNWL